jgi:prepilin-type N-terminal cleavage/methylation domain-containing protein
MNTSRQVKGFTLVELSITLVIMGLLISAVVAGRELVKAAEVKATISELQTYKIATENFKTQYEGLPGDLKNATSFWTGGVTANGNDDGRMGTGAVGDDTEVYYAWDQLSLAKLIAGAYSGAGTEALIGTNVAASTNVKSGGYSFSYLATPLSYVDTLSRGFPANYIILGKNHASDNYLSSAAVDVDAAFSIDMKIDDGTPDFGKVLAGTGGGATGTCVSGSAPDIIYNASNAGVACTLYFSME